MPRKYLQFGITGLLFSLLGFLAKGFLREYVHTQGWNDIGISGWMPSFLYVTGFSQLLLIRTSAYPHATIFIVMIASVLFEVMQWHSTGTADVADVIASIGGGLLSFLIYRGVSKRL
jgi:uncharacterized membrane protein YccC